MARTKNTTSKPSVSKKTVAVGTSSVAAVAVLLYMLGGGGGESLGIQYNGTLSNYTTYADCVNVTLYGTYVENHSRIITTNSTPPTWVENYTSDESYPYTGQSCTEAGIDIGSTRVSYVQDTKQCLRTENILCCWLYADGGVNIQSRSGVFRTSIDSGERGICVDLSNDLTILSKQGEVSIP
jgi:hypothetical protein